MTAEMLAPRLADQPPLTERDLYLRAAAAAVAHPDGRPWRLWPIDRGVEIRADGLRGLACSDAGMRTVRISAGAALLNVRLAMAVEVGCRPLVRLLPDCGRLDVFAAVYRGAAIVPTPAERDLHRAVAAVGRFLPDVGDGEVPAAAVRLIRRAAEAEGLWLRTIADPVERSRIAVDVPSVMRMSGGVLTVIGSNHDVAVAQIRAGQALQRIILTARRHGLTAAVAAWPADLRGVVGLPPSVGGPGVYPHLLVAVGRTATPGTVPLVTVPVDASGARAPRCG